MPKSVFSDAHRHVVDVLVESRRRAGLTQAELGRSVGKDQSFVSLIENAQRRVDVLEFFALSRAMGFDPLLLLAQISQRLPSEFSI